MCFFSPDVYRRLDREWRDEGDGDRSSRFRFWWWWSLVVLDDDDDRAELRKKKEFIFLEWHLSVRDNTHSSGIKFHQKIGIIFKDYRNISIDTKHLLWLSWVWWITSRWSRSLKVKNKRTRHEQNFLWIKCWHYPEKKSIEYIH
jgi:hypothetical protein